MNVVAGVLLTISMVITFTSIVSMFDLGHSKDKSECEQNLPRTQTCTKVWLTDEQMQTLKIESLNKGK